MGQYVRAAERLLGKGLIRIVAACGRSHQRNHVLKELGIPKFTTDHRELIEMDTVDLVLVLTSMNEHGPITRAALDAGKHVLVEKPMAVTLEEAAQIVQLATTSRGYLLCAPYTILSPTYQAIAKRIRRGEIGKVVSARARYGWAGPDWGQWFYRPGGGAIFDLGVYNITSLTGWLGPAKRVMAMTGIAIPEREVNGKRIRVEAEDNAHVLLDFGEAVFAVATTGFTMQQYRSPAIELYGTQGTLQMMGDDWDPDGYELWRNEVGAWQIFKETDPDWPWTDGLRHIVECIQNKVAPIVSPEQAYHVLEILVKAQVSGREGRALLVESTFTPPTFTDVVERSPAHLLHDRTRRD